jgi:hypothetical protein
MGEVGEVRVSTLPWRPNADRALGSLVEVSGYLVGSAAFKAVGTGDPRPAGSIPVHLRQRRSTPALGRAPGDLGWLRCAFRPGSDRDALDIFR